MDQDKSHSKSIDGWVIIVTGIHAEAQEEDIREKFESFGQITNIHLNLDRRSGYVKGYALVEFHQEQEAQTAISEANGSKLLNQTIHVDWAFMS
ncbi:bifunctional RNA recognition motif domain/RNA-binding domain superfamily/RBM8 [Babesia duncani]|uniref:Bifunctional RNA recognition motif domain/RNA-binding domain superfamily/RBM8 n=1 Tax=Babesia duncani TaxID=323732 RepID=A0AAD9PJK5_9APIC|nr:bifunctional RNA recognition motif domain/RNA-binding domain superfamily/RBM8 [Babesia duncani]